jgi:hypothetical protein
MILSCLPCMGHAMQNRILRIAGRNTTLILPYCREKDNVFPCEIEWPGITIEYVDDMSYDEWG